MSWATSIDEGVAAVLKPMAPDLCRDIDYILAQGSTLKNISSIVEKVWAQMGQDRPV